MRGPPPGGQVRVHRQGLAGHTLAAGFPFPGRVSSLAGPAAVSCKGGTCWLLGCRSPGRALEAQGDGHCRGGRDMHPSSADPSSRRCSSPKGLSQSGEGLAGFHGLPEA